MYHNLLSIIISSICLIIFTITGYESIQITRFELPLAVHNGTGPVELICIYEIGDRENGLVIKWYHNMEQIYQWIPPMAPQDIGVIAGFTEYPIENINRPLTHSIIRLRQVNFDMSGDYTCSVNTFHDEVVQTKRMTIYVPNRQLKISANTYNNTHVNLTCIANGARPRPSLSIIVNDKQLDDSYIRIENYRKYPWIYQETIVPNFPTPVVIQCEINIPNTGYRSRNKLVYYPSVKLGSNVALNNLHLLIITIFLITVIRINYNYQ